MSPKISIYIHWPFCLSLCPYCDFNSHILSQIDSKEWLDCYKNELEYFASNIKGKEIASIFFGGGTPSLMDPFLVSGIIDKIAQIGSMAKNVEITLEANPTSYEASKFVNFKQAGINRVSLGIQSLIDSDLQFLGRKHDSAQAIRAIKSASDIFDNYSFDLIYARPGQSLKGWEEELKQAMELAGHHISLYQLTIEKGTPFFKLFKEGRLKLPADSNAADMYDLTNQILSSKGYSRYEISNYAKDGAECKHNLCYWNYQEYLGIGAGAHSRIHEAGQIKSIVMHHLPEKWKSSIMAKSHGILKEQYLSQSEIAVEAIMMGTRLAQGLCKKSLFELTGIGFEQIFNQTLLKHYIDEGFILHENNRLILTDKGLLLHNYLVPRIINV